MHQPIPRTAIGRVPALIKRNTALFALSQSFMGAGTQLAYGIGPLMVIALTGSTSLAGLTVALFGISRFLVAYPVGKITDTYGRKPGIQLGLALALVGAVGSGLAMLFHSIAARHAAIGVSDSGAGAMAVLAAAVTGPLVECTSLPAAGLAAALVAGVPLAVFTMTLMSRQQPAAAS